MYGKDNRVLYSAKFAQGFEVVAANPTWQGAGFSNGGIKIGMTDTVCLHQTNEGQIEFFQTRCRDAER